MCLSKSCVFGIRQNLVVTGLGPALKGPALTLGRRYKGYQDMSCRKIIL